MQEPSFPGVRQGFILTAGGADAEGPWVTRWSFTPTASRKPRVPKGKSVRRVPLAETLRAQRNVAVDSLLESIVATI